MTAPVIGRLATQPALGRPDLLAAPVAAALSERSPDTAFVAEIDPVLADTAEFCRAYDVALDVSVNCVVIAGIRAGERRIAACLVLASTRADVNGVVRRRLNARRASFLPMEDAVEATGMEYGGITPLGLPSDWPILVDPAVTALPYAVVGSGLRRSKLAITGVTLQAWPGAEVIDGLGRPMRRA